MTANVVPFSTCPRCGASSSRVTGVIDDAAMPKEGDLAVCIRCATINAYDAGLRLVTVTEADILALDPDTRLTLMRAQMAILAMHSGRAQA